MNDFKEFLEEFRDFTRDAEKVEDIASDIGKYTSEIGKYLGNNPLELTTARAFLAVNENFRDNLKAIMEHINDSKG